MGVGNILRRSAFNFPDKPALVFGSQRTSYSELNRRVNCVANSLLNMGLKKGDRVAVLLHNCPEFIETYFACAKSGGIFVPINNLLKQKELMQIFEYVNPRFLIFDKEFSKIIESTGPELKSVEFRIVLHDESTAISQYGDLVSGGDGTEPNADVTDDDLVSIILTSGTTGRPKGAMRTHRHDFINMMSCALELGIRHDDRALLLFPFYHVTFADSLRHVLMSNTIVIRREGGFDPEAVLGLDGHRGDYHMSICADNDKCDAPSGQHRKV